MLFVAALAEGLGSGNRNYIEKLNADLLIYQSGVDLSANASRIGTSKLNEIRRVEGVAAAGPIGVASVALVQEGQKPLNVALIGVEPGLPGEIPALAKASSWAAAASRDALLDRNVADPHRAEGRRQLHHQVDPGHQRGVLRAAGGGHQR